ncbi:type IV pilin-like G/H family protein [Limnofasciculus baicalensis]|uniref:Type IV pilin-like G/H family protein n=1 Tax=Limnofasciculus baicalensis BBK-W-15 TaxID=2699891 RepID=A0AAE3GQS6_9CYAN|nr:type IV pilin-like G/H family protein [Limnofasciculus baicalensis]MCP2728211.1 type IV pilin-like G/H family protein [Limnofasciculus baicalensis BBK-W-15]
MKLDLQAKFLQHLSQKKQDQGFTLIELLVVIIIIGILSAIALPSFLNQANKAKQSEAKTITGSMNRAQQAYYLEANKFASDVSNFGELGLGISTQSQNYKFGVKDALTGSGVINFADTVVANAPLKGYYGQVVVGTVAGTGEATTLAKLCEALKPKVSAGGLDGSAGVASNPPVCPTANWKDLSGG